MLGGRKFEDKGRLAGNLSRHRPRCLRRHLCFLHAGHLHGQIVDSRRKVAYLHTPLAWSRGNRPTSAFDLPRGSDLLGIGLGLIRQVSACPREERSTRTRLFLYMTHIFLDHMPLFLAFILNRTTVSETSNVEVPDGREELTSSVTTTCRFLDFLGGRMTSWYSSSSSASASSYPSSS